MENDISGMISKIISDPNFADMVKEIRGGEESREELQKEMLEKLPDVISMVSPMLGGTNNSEEKTEKIETEVKAPPQKYDKARAEKLMGALKPYLKPERRQIIDRCMSVMQLSDVVGAFGGLDGLLSMTDVKNERG